MKKLFLLAVGVVVAYVLVFLLAVGLVDFFETADALTVALVIMAAVGVLLWLLNLWRFATSRRDNKPGSGPYFRR